MIKGSKRTILDLAIDQNGEARPYHQVEGFPQDTSVKAYYDRLIKKVSKMDDPDVSMVGRMSVVSRMVQWLAAHEDTAKKTMYQAAFVYFQREDVDRCPVDPAHPVPVKRLLRAVNDYSRMAYAEPDWEALSADEQDPEDIGSGRIFFNRVASRAQGLLKKGRQKLHDVRVNGAIGRPVNQGYETAKEQFHIIRHGYTAQDARDAATLLLADSAASAEYNTARYLEYLERRTGAVLGNSKDPISDQIRPAAYDGDVNIQEAHGALLVINAHDFLCGLTPCQDVVDWYEQSKRDLRQIVDTSALHQIISGPNVTQRMRAMMTDTEPYKLD